jgi:hypothetical protein
MEFAETLKLLLCKYFRKYLRPTDNGAEIKSGLRVLPLHQAKP